MGICREKFFAQNEESNVHAHVIDECANLLLNSKENEADAQVLANKILKLISKTRRLTLTDFLKDCIVATKKLAENLNTKLINLQKAGHINKEAGYTEFNFLLDLVKSEF